jgi:predicted transcriptional regulator
MTNNNLSTLHLYPKRKNRSSVALNKWQIEEIQKGIDEADRSEFASAKQVTRALKRWTRRTTHVQLCP